MTDSQQTSNPHRAAAPRLTVGIISAGKVGVALGEALQRCGHRVTHVVARSQESRTRARLRLPQAQVSSIAETAAACELVIIAVPDRAVSEVAEEVAGYVGPGRIVMHTAGSLGRAALDAVSLTGALTIAAHPAMTFAGLADDADLLVGCPWGITVGDELAKTVAELLIGELGGRPIFINERSRGLYHAAMAHGSNGLGAVVVDAVEMLARTIGEGGSAGLGAAGSGAGGASGAGGVGSAAELTAGETDLAELRRGQAAELLRPLLQASLDNALRWGSRGLTGPVVRDDLGTVVKHEREIEGTVPQVGGAYLALAERIAELRGSTEVLKYLRR